VAGPNFGTGSSREHAVWALTDYGFEVVISPASATSSATTAPSRASCRLRWTRFRARPARRRDLPDPTLELTVDVARGTIEAPAAGMTGTFPLDEFTRERLLNGWDDIGLTLRHESSIAEYETHRAAWLPVTTG
jgi:3-isopropylmalate/(R)-2-methylmalate dehydratase small subunit